jgi:RimJ/RimL family protein N-acetyltransferase
LEIADYPNKIQLMDFHLEAMFTHNSANRIVQLNVPGGTEAPRFVLGRTAEGHVRRYRQDLPDDLVAELESLCGQERKPDPPDRMPDHLDDYVRLLEAHAPVTQVWSGPAWWVSLDDDASGGSIAITPKDVGHLRGSMDDWVDDVPQMQPMHAVVEGGKAVSICATVRFTDRALAAGVETVEAWRGRGIASRVVSDWARKVHVMGKIPLYSTTWENVASQRVAAKLGLVQIGVDFQVS